MYIYMYIYIYIYIYIFLGKNFVVNKYNKQMCYKEKKSAKIY